MDYSYLFTRFGRIKHATSTYASNLSDKATNAYRSYSTWRDKCPKSAKALKYTLIALVILSILAGALLLGMHFGGLGISKAGFQALGNKFVVWLNTKHTLGAFLLKVILPPIGGVIAIGVAAKYGPRALKQLSAHESKENNHLSTEETPENEEFPTMLLEFSEDDSF